MTTTFLGRTFRVARLDEIPWPTAVGGNTDTSTCPLQSYTNAYQQQHETEPSPAAVKAHVATQLAAQPATARCYHHRWDADQLRYIAEMTCWFVEQSLVPWDYAIQAAVRRDGGDDAYAVAAFEYFADPMRWSFEPGTALSNGRHRTCALKSLGIERVAMQDMNVRPVEGI